MPESSHGVSDPKASVNNSTNTEGRRRSDRRNHRDGGKFEGKCADLKTSTYDVTGAGRDTFIKTTREIAEYIGRTYEDAGEFRTGMVELSLPDLVEPEPPKDEKSFVQAERWKQALRRFEDQKRIRNKNTNQAFALVLGQCSQAICNRMEAHKDWSDINATSNVIKLLELIHYYQQKHTNRIS
jgi:hypothetical protein